MSASVQPTDQTKTSAWQQWRRHPESLWVRRIVFQIHLWAGMLAGLYVSVMSVSGSIIVFRNQLEGARNPESGVVRVVEWLVDLHSNLQFGMAGLAMNGVGAACLTVLCLTGSLSGGLELCIGAGPASSAVPPLHGPARLASR